MYFIDGLQRERLHGHAEVSLVRDHGCGARTCTSAVPPNSDVSHKNNCFDTSFGCRVMLFYGVILASCVFSFSRNPGVHTIEDDLLAALAKAGAFSEEMRDNLGKVMEIL